MTKSMTMTDVVRFELLAAAAGVSFVTLRRRYRAGMLPTPDLSIPAAPAYISAWRVSMKWNTTGKKSFPFSS